MNFYGDYGRIWVGALVLGLLGACGAGGSGDESLDLSGELRGGGRCRRCDRSSPSVTIAAPANNATVSGQVVASGTATDDASLAAVVVELDGVPQVVMGTASWSVTFDASLLAAGSHTLVARAVDATGNTGAATVSFLISTGTGGGDGGGGSGSGGGSGGGAPTGKWVSGYYLGYDRGDYPADEIHFAALTHLVVGRIVPNSNGTLNTTFDIDSVSGPAMARDLSQRARAANVKPILMIGGDGTHDAWVGAASSANRAAFVANLVQVARDYGYDGFDLDWEPLPAADHASFLALVRELRAAMPSAVLTVPINYINANFNDVNPIFGQVAPYVDQLNVMAYGMADNWGGWLSWHSSALYGEKGRTPTSVDSTVRAYVASGIPAAKLGMGIGFYGSCWSGASTPVTGPNFDLDLSQYAGARVVASDETLSFRNIMTRYYRADAYHYDSVAQAPYLGSTSGLSASGLPTCSFISYENEPSVRAKGAYAKQAGLGGTILWNINEGYVPGRATFLERNSLLEAVRQGFLVP